MFKLDNSPAYWWTVKVAVAKAGATAGVVEHHDFDVEFLRMGEEQFAAFVKEAREKNLHDRDLVPRFVRNFRNVADEAEQSLPFNTANLARLLDIPGVAGAIVAAFYASRVPAAEKN